MDRKKAISYLGVMGVKPLTFKKKDGSLSQIQFARAGLAEIEQIEKMSDDELVTGFIESYFGIKECGCSIADIEFKDLMGMEMTSRGIIPLWQEEWDDIKWGRQE